MLIRDKLLARLADMGGSPDYQRLAAETLGIRNATPDLARRLVMQALVIEDRQQAWRRVGERISEQAPPTPGVYVLCDDRGSALYVGKTVNLRRRLRSHFAGRRWRHLKVALAGVADATWQEVGSDLEALLREAALIHELKPAANVQVGPPQLVARAIPRELIRDIIVVLPSTETDSVELVAARLDGAWLIQRTRRDGSDLTVHATRLARFFKSALRRTDGQRHPDQGIPLAPIVFSWLARRGNSATRVDPHDVGSARELRRRLAALFADADLFVERIDQR